MAKIAIFDRKSQFKAFEIVISVVFFVVTLFTKLFCAGQFLIVLSVKHPLNLEHVQHQVHPFLIELVSIPNNESTQNINLKKILATGTEYFKPKFFI